MISGQDRKAEDTAAGCRAHSQRDLDLAGIEPNAAMRDRLQSSAAAWAARASLLQRLEDGRAREAGR